MIQKGQVEGRLSTISSCMTGKILIHSQRDQFELSTFHRELSAQTYHRISKHILQYYLEDQGLTQHHHNVVTLTIGV